MRLLETERVDLPPLDDVEEVEGFLNVVAPGARYLSDAVKRLPAQDYWVDWEFWSDAESPFVHFRDPFFTSATLQRVSALALRALGLSWSTRRSGVSEAMIRVHQEAVRSNGRDLIARVVDPDSGLLDEIAAWALGQSPAPNIVAHFLTEIRYGELELASARQLEYVLSIDVPPDAVSIAEWVATGSAGTFA